MYLKLLFKKFVFQIHPDFFAKYKKYQEINSKNLIYLKLIIDSKLSKTNNIDNIAVQNEELLKFNNGDTKNLIFFIKSLDLNDEPKRVKLSIQYMEKSMIEILETIGIDLPSREEGYHSYSSSSEEYNTMMLATPQQVIDYLLTMNERKDLITWREERLKKLQVEEEV